FGVLAVAGLSYLGHGPFDLSGDDPETVPPPQSANNSGGGGGAAKAPVVSSTDLTPAGLAPDTWASYTQYREVAEAALAKSQHPRARGLLLGAIALTLTRYPEAKETLEPKGLALLGLVQKDPESEWSQFGQG